MPNNQEAVVFYCPSCGASIAMHGDQGACAFCGTAIERPKPGRQPRPARSPQDDPTASLSPSITIQRAVAVKPARGGSCLAALIALLVLAATGLGVGMAVTGGQLLKGIAGAVDGTVSLPAALSRIELGPITALAAVLPRDGAGGDLLVYTYGISDSRYSLALIDGGSQAPRWQSQPLSK